MTNLRKTNHYNPGIRTLTDKRNNSNSNLISATITLRFRIILREVPLRNGATDHINLSFHHCTLSSACNDAFPLVYRILVLVFVLLIVGIIVWIIVANWHRIKLTVRIISVASYALSRNLGLFLVIPLLTLGLVVCYAPIVVFLVFARFNGRIVAKESNGEYTCVWKQDSWVPAYYALAILTMLWNLTTMVEAQVYVISGTIAQWYFSKDDTKLKITIFGSSQFTVGWIHGMTELKSIWTEECNEVMVPRSFN